VAVAVVLVVTPWYFQLIHRSLTNRFHMINVAGPGVTMLYGGWYEPCNKLGEKWRSQSCQTESRNQRRAALARVETVARGTVAEDCFPGARTTTFAKDVSVSAWFQAGWRK